jgi:hypothetical protein
LRRVNNNGGLTVYLFLFFLRGTRLAPPCGQADEREDEEK